ncbi:LysM domain-containing protein [Roseibium sp. TrichSKD4]|nr:LysM domain-containing protein [Roseibium sp. TrichSKD4]
MRQNVIWALGIASVVAVVAIGVGYFKWQDGTPEEVALKAPSQTETVTGENSAAGSSASSDGSTSSNTEVAANSDGLSADQSDQTDGDEAAPRRENQGDALSFDVVGVEPTGEAVIAGRSDAGAIVALRANGDVVGKGVANSAGEWTIILDKPLGPGDYDVALEMQSEDGETKAASSERLVVSIPEGGQDQPLVVLNSPDAPSSILQKPEQPNTAVAAAETPEPKSAVVEAAEDLKETVASGVEQVEDAAETTVAAVEETVGEGAEAVASEASSAATDVAESVETAANGVVSSAKDLLASNAVKSGQADSPSQGETSEVVAVDPAAIPAGGAVTSASGETTSSETSVNQTDNDTDAANVEATEIANASGQPESGAPSESADQPRVTVEAVESEKGKVFVAGTGEPGSEVRVYVDDKFAGEAEVPSSGRWLLEGTEDIAEGNVEVRADLVEQGADKVEARAAVTFEKAAPQQIVLTKVIASGEVAQEGSDGARVTKALPNVIIRKGDNLWRISRRLYGEGIRYTTIYQANQGQIRNPDLIYPGQVFLTPENDLRWKENKTDETATQ